MTSMEIEIAIARKFNSRINLIVPNVYWGLGFRYELDLMIVTPSGWAYEVEIKTTASDLKADLKKRNHHNSNKIKLLYFAIPESLKPHMNIIPNNAGIFTIHESGYTELIRAPIVNRLAKRLSEKDIDHLKDLCSMRMWNLKEKLFKNYKKKKIKG